MAFTCKKCGESFKKPSQLAKHRRTCTTDHGRDHKCDTCKKCFSRAFNLKRHQAIHRDFRQHKCLQCSMVFTRSDSLDRHMRTRHQQGGGVKRKHDEAPDEKRAKIDDPKKYYSMKKTKQVKMIKFNTTSSTYVVAFRDIEVEGLREITKTLERIFASIMAEVTTFASPKDLIRLVVQSPELDFPITLPFIQKNVLNVELFLSEIERVLQSCEEFVLDKTLEIEITHVIMPSGGSRKSCKYVNYDRFLKDKRCIIRILNNDELCCARAIVTAKARLDKHKQWESIRHAGYIQKQLAEELHDRAGVPQGRCGIEELKKFQVVMCGYQIHVRDQMNADIYKGPDSEKKIHLLLHNDHYNIITSMTAFISRVYYCYKCEKGYSNKEKHKCNNACDACRKIHDSTGTLIDCRKCHRQFNGQECYDLHQKSTKKGTSTCHTIYQCGNCHKTINRGLHKTEHVCGETLCKTCSDYFPEGHQCYMKRVTSKTVTHDDGDTLLDEKTDIDNECEPNTLRTFIFYDMECTQDDMIECETGYAFDQTNGKCKNCGESQCGSLEHKPNLCVVHKVCEDCLDREVDECENCEVRERVFSGSNTTDDFCEWLFSEDNERAIVLAHNFKGYDSYPVMQYLYRNGIKPKIISNGSKIMLLFVKECKIKMIDSMNFLPMAISKLPGMFQIPELYKGHFPHLYNRKENQRNVLKHLPEPKYYNPDGMKSKDRKCFYEWYHDNKNSTFDLQKELLKYCRSDVDILRRCCLKFRELFMEMTSSVEGEPVIDPFEHCFTLASACNLVFRAKFLKSETIGIIKHHGYKPELRQSIKALQWIKYVSRQLGMPIQHARNGGEKKIGKYLVDGYYKKEDGEEVVLEFHGDFWHGNPKCYSSTTLNPVNDTTMGELYERTLIKKRYIEGLGYTYIAKWEHDFDNDLRENEEMKTFINKLEFVTPLEPRDAFFGGRTESFTLVKEASGDDSIDYYDVTSLYPWVNKTGKVPLGHPSIITEDFDEINKYEGIIKCKVLPPRGLYIPVLPVRMNDKLLFVLCKTCAETNQQSQCQHNDEERALIGTWVTDELKMAISKGYKVEKIYEAWNFDKVAQYDPFTDYVNTFLKMKQEASGWPKWCESEHDKQKYIDDYHMHEGIHLEYSNIKKNPGLRAVAKLMLNSFWGKFGQRPNMPRITYVTSPTIFYDKLTSDQQEVLSVNFVSEEMVEMTWKNNDDFIETSGRTNVAIAAYTTAQARLKLYSYIEKLGPRTLYVDTDSVIFTSQPGEWKPPLGDYLGDLKDEIPNNKMISFATAGPKNYGYELDKPGEDGNRTCCKVRGITLNYKNSKDINYYALKRMVTESRDETITVKDNFKIYRDSKNRKLLTKSEHKVYKYGYDKRVTRDHINTFPYGF